MACATAQPVMELYGRRRCTAILQLDRSSAPYRRSDITELVSRVVHRANVEAIGQLNNSVWEVVFRDEATKERFVGMELEVKGKRAAKRCIIEQKLLLTAYRKS